MKEILKKIDGDWTGAAMARLDWCHDGCKLQRPAMTASYRG